ncbi:CARDB domain-containing protein [Hymenobacter psychrophilus]|uniref:Por secretion system C-terminal sorting domain-containing protein n=1 Tax=Hymenobacter psychrophilus TaxID=651662 RepID=A0A1H3EF82_9BACT|nr:CARDB domain-containing protein [Hymenobacter psychrophilus]SDX77392.1 Por secretion system C-terminal sorting domain-containing protein [Hymenobacter psychrophilus]
MKKCLRSFLWLLILALPRQMQAQNLPDLVLVAPFSLPTAVIAGAAYPMSANIRVNGNPGAGAQFNCVGYYLSEDAIWDATDAYLGASCQGLLLAGQSGPTSITGIIPPLTSAGKHYLVLVADPLNAERESNETNNVVSFPVQVTKGGVPMPDLTLLRPSISFSTVPAGGNTGAFAFIINQGLGSANGYEVGFFLSTDTVFSAGTDVFMGQITGGSLGGNIGGGSPSTIFSAPVLPVPQSTVSGTYYLLLVIDPRDLLAESDETNNSRALRLTVTGGPVTATASAANEAVQLYPNPVAAGVPIRVQLGAAARTLVGMTLLDGLGRVVAQKNWRPGQAEATLETESLPAGLYTLRLTGPAQQVVRRVLVK